MTQSFVTSTGKTIEVGRELGKGGEGSVYEVIANHLWVAKLYSAHHQPDALKQAKLRFMATTVDEELPRFTAWPQEILHKTANGPIVGFLMPKVRGRVPIHTLYSPAHRRQDYPQAAWDFLLLAARNTAAAFAAIHRHGHVLGDVNQGNVLVGADSKVILIDTDSFQINANGTTYLCNVGVAHFTPPEMQAVTSFDLVPRTSNHDNFGLALLVFHLLFGGRHPYSGVPLRMDVGEALEKDIEAFRYAYAPDGRWRGLNPPPKSIPIDIVPDNIQAMFTLAFTETGAKQNRPTAHQWVTALDDLRGQLKRCPTTVMHIYPGHLCRCPWCTLENNGVVYFLDIRVGVTPIGTTGFVLARVWAAIEAIQPPPAIPIPSVAANSVTPTPLPHGVTKKATITFMRIVIVGITLYLFETITFASHLVLVMAVWMWMLVNDLRNKQKVERTKRQVALDNAQQAYDQIVSMIRHVGNPEEFVRKKQNLALLRDEYIHLPELEKVEIINLQTTAEARQKHRFLERHYIDSAAISGIGPAKKESLRSFGIETAADVTWSKVISVVGFGEVLTRAVVDWRKACERRFVFNPSQALTEADKNAVRAKIMIRKRAIEIALNGGVAHLQRLRQEMISRSEMLYPTLQAASQKLAQSHADFNAT